MSCEENTKPLINKSYLGYDLEINSNLVLKAIKRVCNGKTNDSRRLMGRELKLRLCWLKPTVMWSDESRKKWGTETETLEGRRDWAGQQLLKEKTQIWLSYELLQEQTKDKLAKFACLSYMEGLNVHLSNHHALFRLILHPHCLESQIIKA